MEKDKIILYVILGLMVILMIFVGVSLRNMDVEELECSIEVKDVPQQNWECDTPLLGDTSDGYVDELEVLE